VLRLKVSKSAVACWFLGFRKGASVTSSMKRYSSIRSFFKCSLNSYSLMYKIPLIWFRYLWGDILQFRALPHSFFVLSVLFTRKERPFLLYVVSFYIFSSNWFSMAVFSL